MSLKILVVGAGIAGPAVCYWLKKFGFSPTLIEKTTQVRKGGQAIDIRGIAVDVVKKMRLYNEICQMRTRIAHGRYLDTQGNIIHEEEGEKSGFRQGEEVEILRGDLVEILLNSIKDIPCYFGKQINRIIQNENMVTAHFQDGNTQQYDILIAADGIHSAIRRMIFAKDEYQLLNLGFYLSIFNIPNYLNLSHTELVCEANHKLVSITSDNHPDLAQAGFTFRSQHRLQDIRDEKEQQQFLCESFNDFGWEANQLLTLMPHCTDFYFDEIAQVKMKQWTKGRIALVGDAGYTASPLSGQGTSLALVGAYILAGELKNAKNVPTAFNRYNEILHPFVAANQAFGVWVSQSFLMQSELSPDIAMARSKDVMQRLQAAANAITLPIYEV